MKRIIAYLLSLVLVVISVPVMAFNDYVTDVNEKYSDYIAEAIERTHYDDKLDTDSIYIIEKTTLEELKNNTEPLDFYVAIPIKGSDDIAYTLFMDGDYVREKCNVANKFKTQTFYKNNLDEYIANNNIDGITEIVNTYILARGEVCAYRVETKDATYYIPYCLDTNYNAGQNDECALEIGKAYEKTDFINRVEKEEQEYPKYLERKKKEQQQKAEEEWRKKYIPIISADENGDKTFTINGVNIDDLKNEIIQNIEPFDSGSFIRLKMKDNKNPYQVKYSYDKNRNTDEVKQFVEGLFEEIKHQITSGEPELKGNYTGVDIYLKDIDEINLHTRHHDTGILIYKDGIKMDTQNHGIMEFKIKNSKYLIEYLEKYCEDGLDSLKKVRYDKTKPSVNGPIPKECKKTDYVEFEFTLLQNSDNYITKTVANPGEKVTGLVERYVKNKYHAMYLLTLSGSIGKTSLYVSGEPGDIFSREPISFYSTLRYEDGNLVRYVEGVTDERFEFEAQIVTTEMGKKHLGVDKDIYDVFFDGIECENAKYIKLSDNGKQPEKEEQEDKKDDEYEKEDEDDKADTDDEDSDDDDLDEDEKHNNEKDNGKNKYADILFAFGIFKGTDKGYELDKGLTREESVTILVRLLGEEKNINPGDFNQVFKDVDKNRWSYSYVMYCYTNNITNGTGDATFSPDSTIDANQFVALILRLLGYTDAQPETALEKSVECELLSSECANELKTANTFTREDMVEVVYECLDTKMADDTLFSDYLMDKGVITDAK